MVEGRGANSRNAMQNGKMGETQSVADANAKAYVEKASS